MLDRVDPRDDPDRPWSTPESEQPRQGRRWLIAVSIGLALLLAGSAATAYLFVRPDGSAQRATSSDAAPSGRADPTGQPGTVTDQPGTQPGTGRPTPEPSTDVLSVDVGDCVRNDGDDRKPKLVVVECAAKTYQVLARVEGKVTGERDATKKCADAKDYTNWYYYDSPRDDLDFVLCLKRRG